MNSLVIELLEMQEYISIFVGIKELTLKMLSSQADFSHVEIILF